VPTCPSSYQARLGSLPDEVTLELGQRADDVEDELAATRPGVQLLLQAPEVDALLVKLPDGLDEVLERPP